MSDTLIPPGRLYIGPLSEKVREKELTEIFGKYGKIKEIAHKNTYAFLEYEDEQDAEKAISALHSSEIDGQTVKVEHVKDRKRTMRDERGPRKCYNCGRDGHWVKNCPDARGPDKSRCFNCQEEGHLARDCPQPDRGGRARGGGGAGSGEDRPRERSPFRPRDNDRDRDRDRYARRDDRERDRDRDRLSRDPMSRDYLRDRDRDRELLYRDWAARGGDVRDYPPMPFDIRDMRYRDPLYLGNPLIPASPLGLRGAPAPYGRGMSPPRYSYRGRSPPPRGRSRSPRRPSPRGRSPVRARSPPSMRAGGPRTRSRSRSPVGGRNGRY